MSAQWKGSHSSKEDISKELVINSSLPVGQEAVSSKHKIGQARFPQLSLPREQGEVMGMESHFQREVQRNYRKQVPKTSPLFLCQVIAGGKQ